VKLVDIDVIVW